jgi:membrane dipeptidase
MYSRGWNAEELSGLASGNFLRVFAQAEEVAREMAREGAEPAQDLYEKRVDVAQKHEV